MATSQGKLPRLHKGVKISPETAKKVGDHIGVDWNLVDLEQFRAGLEVESEHGSSDKQTDVTHDQAPLIGKLALAHLKELRDYYARLEKMEKSAGKT